MDLFDEKAKSDSRIIQLDAGEPRAVPSVSNSVHAGKYTLKTILPLALVHRLMRISSLWFVVVIICEVNPFIADPPASYASLALFVLHLLINLMKTAVAMHRSKAEDANINRSSQQVWRGEGFEEISCERLKVGDCVLVTDGMRTPADILLLATSAGNGTCHMSTIRTLGESSLVMKTAVRETHRMLVNEYSPQLFNIDRFNATITVESPNPDFLSFSGTIKLRHFPRAVPLKYDNFALKGSILQGEEWMLGIVLYAGMESKYWSNLTHRTRRFSFIERILTWWIAVSMLLISCSAGLGALLQFGLSQTAPTFTDFVYYLNLYHTIVPLFSILALDVLRVVHAFVSSDARVTVTSSCKTEDLGKVGFVLADKTGTVTQNKLELLAVLIGNQLYSKVEMFSQFEAPDDSLRLEAVVPCCVSGDSVYSFEDLKQQMRLGDKSEGLRRFCECVALCNSVIPMPDESFLGTSVDEEALMQGATELGFTLYERTAEDITILIFEECVQYEVLCMKKFSSDVKRMRILVTQEVDPSHATLFIKGSYKALQGMLSMPPEDRRLLTQRLDQMSRKGLRIMVMCYRNIDGEYLAEVKTRISTITSSRKAENVEGNLEVLFMELEQNLTFLGVTGVRDHLQEGAVEAVETLKTAGISTWLLSGEGESNTLACARELSLFPSNSPVLSLTGLRKTEECTLLFSKAANELLHAQDPHLTDCSSIAPQVDTRRTNRLFPHNFALSVDGETLKKAMRLEETQRLLLFLMLSASAVCFSTMHPSHKKEAVQLLRQAVKSDLRILAVGDGVSDVPMLLEADISVGIRNEESEPICQVSATSFADLPHLILSSGRRSTAALLKMITLFLYSQMLIVVGMLAMTMVADFTPSELVPWGLLNLYQGVLSLLPIVGLSVLLRGRRETIEDQVRVKLATAESGWKSVSLQLAIAGLQSVGIAGFLFVGCCNGVASLVTLEELTFMYISSVLMALCIHCLTESPRAWEPHTGAVLVACGCLYAYYGSYSDGVAVLSNVFASAKFVLAVLGAVLFSAVVSVLTQKLSFFHDMQKFLSSKVVPLNLPESDLAHIVKASNTVMRAYSSLGMETDPEANDKYALRRLTATFVNSQTEKRFQDVFLKANRGLYWGVLGIVLVQALIPFLIETASGSNDQFATPTKSAAFTAVSLLVLAFAVKNIAQLSAQTCALGILVVAFVLNILWENHSTCVFFYITVCLLLFLREKWLPNVVIATLATVLLICSEIAAAEVEDVEDWQGLISAVGTVVVQVFTLTLAGEISFEKALVIRGQFKLIEESKENIEQSSTILGYLLPQFVCNLVKDGLSYTAEDQGEVTILFIDIYMFDHICASFSPPELITLLDDIFQRIDELCSSLHVAKIETVGKTYLACAGLRDFEFEETGEYSSIPHAKRALDLAFAVLRNFKSTKLMHDHFLSFKIGIHTGPVIAGVVGFHKPQFVLVGDTVNTASRMASTLESCDSVQISEATHLRVQSRPEFEFDQREIQVKGKGPMTTYLVKHNPKHYTSGSESPRRMHSHAQRTIRNRHSSLEDMGAILKLMKDNSEKLKWFSCAMSEHERDFRLKTQMRLSGRIRLGLMQFSLGMFCLFVIRSLVERLDSGLKHLVPTVLYVLLSALGNGFLLFYKDLVQRPAFPWMLACLYVTASFAIGIDSQIWDVMTIDLESILTSFLLVLVNFSSGMLFRTSIVATVLLLLPHIWTTNDVSGLQRDLFFFLFASQCCILQFATERSQRAFYRTSKLATREIEKTEQLLKHMIPVQAYKELRQGQWSTDRLTHVSILFADISGFTSWASAHTPEKVIEKLSAIFTAFDKICVERELYKVCTIGDCYVALSSTSNGEGRNPGEECVRMVNFAYEMIGVIEKVCLQDGEQLRMRIGVHVGEVIAGITGSRIVRYDIYGPDVVLANKMESSGAVGRVNVSKEAKSLLKQANKDKYQFKFNAKVALPEIDRCTEAYFVSFNN